ncbi:unnamed protein product [Closterium sp. NIES-64]|nr:unnamed protein product [Closterium sp. NIES-64]CAI5979390.1 unnamed protein product [Closterium sp. NIES-65]
MTWIAEWLGSLPTPLLLLLSAALLALVWILALLIPRLVLLNAGISGSETEALYMEDPTSVDKVPLPSLFAPAEKYLTVVCPAYNEDRRIAATLDEIISYVQERSAKDAAFTYEVLVVDDGSTDSTVAVVFDYVKRLGIDRVRVVKQRVNHGKGAAVRKGALCSRGELILFADADGATRFTDLEKLEREIVSMAKGGPVDSQSAVATCPGIGSASLVAFGSRAHLEKKALVNRKWYRNVLMYGFYFAVLLATGGTGVRDTQCGFKMFTRSAARKLFRNQRLNRWTFDVELLYLCKKLHIRVAEVAVAWTEIPGSKLRPTSILHMLFELALIRIGYGLRIWKLKQDLINN